MQVHLRLMQRVYREVPDLHMRSGFWNLGRISAHTRMHVSAYFPATTKMTVFLHIAGSVQGRRLQHEVAYEGTIPTICFTGDHPYASTAK